jgi:hypothetical protein
LDFGSVILLIIVSFVCCLASAGAGYYAGVIAPHIDRRESLKNQHQQHMITQAKLQAQGKTP